MGAPFIGQGGRIRLSPLEEAVSSNKASIASDMQSAGSGGSGAPSAGGGSQTPPPVPQPSPQDIAKLKAAAAAGDKNAAGLLEMLAAGGGIIGAGLLAKHLANRRGGGGKADAATVADIPTGSTSRELAVPVTPLRNERLEGPYGGQLPSGVTSIADQRAAQLMKQQRMLQAAEKLRALSHMVK